MASSDHLNEQLFHGTGRKFKVGDVILPASKTGVRQNWGAKSKNDPSKAYATDELDSAKYYARVSSLSSEGTPRVYQVEPLNPDTAGWTETKFRDGILRQHVSTEGYRVVGRVWTQRNRSSK